MGRSWLDWFWLGGRGRSTEVPAQRRLVIGDIHGCSRTLRALLADELRITPADQIFFLGDLVSKGPDSLGVLEYVEELYAAQVPVTIVRGNHEEAILRARASGKSEMRTLLERTQNSGLLDRKGKDLDPRWLAILERSVYFVMLPDAVLVHGGVDYRRNEPFADGGHLVNARETVYDAAVAGDRPVVHGHTRSPLSSIIESLVNRNPVLPLDNGAVGATPRKPFKLSEYGNLCCLDLDNWSLHVQPNRDIEDENQGRPAFSFSIRASRDRAGIDAAPSLQSAR
jgi:serine/threonine protein phosphatase 1